MGTFTVTIPEITYNIDDLTSPDNPVPLYNQRSESELAHAYVTIDPATGEVSTTTRFIGDAWDRRFTLSGLTRRNHDAHHTI